MTVKKSGNNLELVSVWSFDMKKNPEKQVGNVTM